MAAKRLKTNVEQRSLAELMASLDPDNPRIHTVDTDLVGLALRLLHNGWQKIPTWNRRNKKLVGGHGRVMACEYLVQQNKEWFADQWQLWEIPNASKYSADEIAIAKLRYTAGYWLQIPILIVDLSEKHHKIALIALNNTEAKGKDDDAMVAKILSKLGNLSTQTAGWEDLNKRQFLSRFGLLNAEHQNAEQTKLANEFADFNAGAIASTAMHNFQSPKSEDEEYIDADTETEGYADEEGEVPEGGANFNADPSPNEKPVTMYPLAVVLGASQAKRYYALKEKLKVKQDLTMLRFHPAFAAKPVDGGE